MPLIDSEATIPWRVQQLERVTEKLDAEKADEQDLQALVKAVNGLRRVLITFMATVSGSALLVSFTLLEVAVRSGH